VRLLARCFVLLVGTLIYHQCCEPKRYQERLRASCAAKGGKLTLTNLCIDLSWANEPTDDRSSSATRPGFRLQAASRW